MIYYSVGRLMCASLIINNNNNAFIVAQNRAKPSTGRNKMAVLLISTIDSDNRRQGASQLESNTYLPIHHVLPLQNQKQRGGLQLGRSSLWLAIPVRRLSPQAA